MSRRRAWERIAAAGVLAGVLAGGCAFVGLDASDYKLKGEGGSGASATQSDTAVATAGSGGGDAIVSAGSGGGGSAAIAASAGVGGTSSSGSATVSSGVASASSAAASGATVGSGGACAPIDCTSCNGCAENNQCLDKWQDCAVATPCGGYISCTQNGSTPKDCYLGFKGMYGAAGIPMFKAFQSCACLAGACGGLCDCTCFDGAKNNTETATDCGGPLCLPCGPQQQCIDNTDCLSGNCMGSFCQ